MRFLLKTSMFFLQATLLTTLIGCGSGTSDPTDPTIPKPNISSSLTKFSSQSEYASYLEKMEEAFNSSSGNSGDATTEANEEGTTEASSDNGSNNQEITNNQEAGVDEGGIVKNYKDLLVILRRGKISTQRLGEDGIQQVSNINVDQGEVGNRVWYDEMLIRDNRVIVIGYRWHAFQNYSQGLTEIAIFSIDENGILNHKVTRYFDSSDYFSGFNYTSRQVGDKLILNSIFIPNTSLKDERDYTRALTYKLENGEIIPTGTLFDGTDVYKPVQEIYWPALHSVISCDIDSLEDLNCQTKTIMAPYYRTYYVSTKMAYLWIWGNDGFGYLYGFGHNNNTSGVVKTPVMPLSMLAMDETSNGISLFGHQYREDKTCDEFTLTDIDFSDFSNTPKPVPSDKETCISVSGRSYSYWAQARFTDNYLAFSEDTYFHLYNRQAKSLKTIQLGQYPSRIERAGDNFVVIGQLENSYSTRISLIDTADLSVSGTYTVPNSYEAEWRTHGFAYDNRDSGKYISVALREWDPEDDYYWYSMEASMNFLRITTSGELELALKVTEQDFTKAEEGCTTSCVDWYGNMRPIFLEDGILALIGDQLTSILEGSDDELTIENYLNINTGESISPEIELED